MIKEKRNELGFTQEKMASELNISLRQYARIDKEYCFPRSDILGKLIIALNLSNEEIGEYVRSFLSKKAE